MSNLKPAQIEILKSAVGGDLVADTVDERIAHALIKRGYLIAVPRDGEASLLTITREGREAAGVRAPKATPVRKIEPAESAPVVEIASGSKTATLRGLLERPEGATVVQMSETTGWLPHSVRGFMAGTLKKKLGLQLVSEKTPSGRVYRLVGATA